LDASVASLHLRAGVAEQIGRPADTAAMEEGERGRSWYLSKEQIERGSPSRRDSMGAAKEAQLRTTYCFFIREVGLRLQL
jgi:cyclin T